MNDRKTVLVVEDSALMRTILINLLRDEYEVVVATDGFEALEQLDRRPYLFSTVLLDLVMPGMDGFQVLSYMKLHSLLERVPVIIITAEESENNITLAYDIGASEVIQKPFNPSVVKRRVRNLVSLYSSKRNLEKTVEEQTESLRLQTQKLIETNDMMIDALSTIIEYRNLESGQHIRRIRVFTQTLLETIAHRYPQHCLTPEKIQMISGASAMHDIGKIAIPDLVLLKPNRLSAEEFDVMKTHTIKGCEILAHLGHLENKDYLSYCYEICLHHHERWDGNGYPDGLSGDQISISSQVVSIADVYDALTHKRVYKPAYSHQHAAEMIFDGECGLFSPFLLDCFYQSLPLLEKISIRHSDEQLFHQTTAGA